MIASHETWLKWMRKLANNNTFTLPDSYYKKFVSNMEKIQIVSSEYVDKFCTEEAMQRMLGMSMQEISLETKAFVRTLDKDKLFHISNIIADSMNRA